MRLSAIILVSLFSFTCAIAQQYPFVHYTPKDGLISNQIRNFYQDSKGRLYFGSFNGLSVYDGSGFINYTQKNGLAIDIVNCVIEMGDDSVWIITNSNKINCLVNGRLKTLSLKDSIVPIINQIIKDDRGTIYAAADQGLFLFDKDHFKKLPITDTKGKDINIFISRIHAFGNYLLLQRDNTTLLDNQRPLYLFNKINQSVVAEISNVYDVSLSTDGRIWLSTDNNIRCLDTGALRIGKFILKELGTPFEKLNFPGLRFVHFDQEGNCWLGDQNTVLIKVAPDGSIRSFTSGSGLSMAYIENIFQDREGITWIATNNAGLNKLVRSDFSFTENPFNISGISDISYYGDKKQVLIYSYKNHFASFIRNNKLTNDYEVKDGGGITRLFETRNGIFGLSVNSIYKMRVLNRTLYPEVLFSDPVATGTPLVDKYGNIILCGRDMITAIVNGKTISRKKLNQFADQAALDNVGNIWVVTREGELNMYKPRPENPSEYFDQQQSFSKELSGISPRSITIDKKNNIWIGTRIHGLHVYNFENGNLKRRFNLSTAEGLSDDFITSLTSDSSNNIWVCSPSGLDRIQLQNDRPVIENITKQNNIHQTVFKVIVDQNDMVWGLLSNGIIKLLAEKKLSSGYSPTLMLRMIKAGKDTINQKSVASLSYKQNNLSFYFAATSFLDEKRVLYSYLLEGPGNNQWSEPSNTGAVSFIGLQPGKYTLHIKAGFPAGSYPDQVIKHQFSINPPWWQTNWFRITTAILMIGILVIGVWYYSRRKLIARQNILERQQAIEKERTRIATDMHDDFGAGLSRIKFLTQAISDRNPGDIGLHSVLEKIAVYSDEMTEKMGEIIWALNEKNDTLADLIAYTRSYAVEYLSNHKIRCEANTPLHLPATFIPGDIRRNIFLSVKECLHNIVKHANATNVFFSAELNESIQICVHDNGQGIDWDNHKPYRNGIQNMQKRMAEINGTVEFENHDGTKVMFSIPIGI